MFFAYGGVARQAYERQAVKKQVKEKPCGQVFPQQTRQNLFFFSFYLEPACTLAGKITPRLWPPII